MVIIGLLLVAAVVALTAGVLVGNTEAVPVDIFGLRGDLAVGAVFVLGAVALAVLVLGVVLIRAGAARRMRKRREIRRLREEHQQAMDRLAAEQAREDEPAAAAESTPADGYGGHDPAAHELAKEPVDLRDHRRDAAPHTHRR